MRLIDFPYVIINIQSENQVLIPESISTIGIHFFASTLVRLIIPLQIKKIYESSLLIIIM